MKTYKIGGKNVVIFDSVEDLPVFRFYKYNKMLLIDAGIGADLIDANRHLERAIIYCGSKPDKAHQELENLRQTFHFIQSEINPKHLAFAARVYSIDGDVRSDVSDEGLKATLDLLRDSPVSQIEKVLGEIKKKLDTELLTYFPTIFADSQQKEFFDLLRSKVVEELGGLLSDEDRSDVITQLNNKLLTFSDPETFGGSKGVEVNFDRQFTEMGILLSHRLGLDHASMTVLEFYNAFEYLKDQEKKDRKNRNGK